MRSPLTHWPRVPRGGAFARGLESHLEARPTPPAASLTRLASACASRSSHGSDSGGAQGTPADEDAPARLSLTDPESSRAARKLSRE